jgi:hypothetical protein
MRILLKIIVFLGFLILFNGFYGCKKDFYVVDDESEHCECETYYDLQGYNTDLNSILDTNIVYYPAYNPNNDNEFIYVNKISNVRYLYRYNMVTNEKLLIGTFPMVLSFDWGRNDWILLEIGDYNVWKMKSNGDSLTQLTSGIPYFHPKWNYDASKIMTYFYNSIENYTEVLNSSGVTIDTLEDYKIYEICRNGSWNNSNGIVIGTNMNGIRIIDPFQKSVIKEKTFSENINEIVWINSTTAIFNNAFGLYQYNFLSNTIKKLRCQCPKVMYQRLKPNSSGTKLLMSKMTYDQIGTTINFNITFEIVQLDLETMIETVMDVN